jgi:hypothetical protein
MAIRKKLIKRLKKIQEELNIPRIPITTLENLSIETRKAFDESIKYLMVKRGLFKKVKVRRDYLKLWRHRENQIVLPINWRYILSMPFIYGMIVPAIVWNLGLEIYHQICFRLYGIPLVDAEKYFIYDRQLMSYLNWWEKINCYYCSYVNNLISYSSEIGGRTERYWCPIKYFRRVNNAHSQYPKFIDGKNKGEIYEKWSLLRNFSDIDK